MASYTESVKVGKWIKQSQVLDKYTTNPLQPVAFYSKRIGTSGYGACGFYKMKSDELNGLIKYFNKFSIPYLEFTNTLTYNEDTIWWSYCEYHNSTNNSTTTLLGKYPITSSGYQFILSIAAYEKLMKANA